MADFEFSPYKNKWYYTNIAEFEFYHNQESLTHDK